MDIRKKALKLHKDHQKKLEVLEGGIAVRFDPKPFKRKG